jgi:threonine synthase
VPTGNFGNVLAGWLAQRMGLPCGTFRVATNQNDILHHFFTTGEYRQGEVHPSHAPSMDIQAASNFERFLYFILGENPERIREVMAQIKSGTPVKIDLPATTFRASRMDDATIIKATAQMWKDHHYVLDPHTACAFTDMAQDRVSIVLSTASPAKFPDVVQQATGSEPIHPSLEALKAKDMRRWPLEATTDAVKAFIRAKKA